MLKPKGETKRKQEKPRKIPNDMKVNMKEEKRNEIDQNEYIFVWQRYGKATKKRTKKYERRNISL